MAYLYDLHAHYSNGFLPVTGGILDQPAKLMDALAIVASEKYACEDEKRQEEAEREKRQSAQVEAMQRGSNG